MSEVELKSRLETDEDGGGKEAGKGLRRITMSVDGGSIEGECAGKERQVRARVTRQYPATKWAKEDTTETESKPGSSSVSGERVCCSFVQRVHTRSARGFAFQVRQ